MADYSLLVNVEAIDKASHVFKTIQGNVNSFKQNLEGTAAAGVGSMEQLGTSMQTLGNNMSNTGRVMTATVTTPIVALGVSTVKTAAEFDSAMSKVQAVSGATGKDFDDLRAKAREMGAKTKFSASEAAEAMNYMAMAGWKTADMLDGIEGIMNLAAASGEDLGTTSDIVTDALTAFGLSASDSAHFADILAAASSNANTNVSMMGETFKYCAPVAGALGFSAEDTAQAIGLMANSGIKASQAGTSLRTIMNQMAGDIEVSGQALGNVTIATTNADGSMRDLNDILADCRVAWSQMSESEQAANAQAIFGKNAMSGWLALMNAAPADIEKLNTAISTCSDEIDGYNGVCEQMAAVMQDNLEGQLTILKSQLQELAISLGEVMIPVVREVVTIIQGVVDKFNQLSPATKELIVKALAVAAAIGPILLIGGKLISGIGTLITLGAKVGSVVGGIGTASAAAAPAVGTAGTAMGTLTANALGFIALGAGILLAATGLALLAQAAIALGQAGAPAAIAMGAMVAVIALLAVGAAALAPALTAGAVGLVAFGAAVALVGVGILAASAGMTLLATQLPTIAQYGDTAAIAVAKLGAAMLVYSAGAVTAAGSSVTLSAGIVTLAAGMATGAVGASAMALAFVAATGSTVALDLALAAMLVTVSGISDAASTASQAMSDIQSSLDVVKVGVTGLGDLFSGAVTTIIGAFTANTGTAQAAALAFGTAITLGAKTGLTPIQTNTTLTMAAVLLVITTSMTQANTVMTGKMNMMKTTVQTGMNNIKQTWQTGLQGLNTTTSQQMQQLQNTVQQALNSIQQKFASTQLRFNQHIALPHFSMSGSFNAQTGETPSVSVSWYRKAYDQAYMFQTPTVFGASGFGDGNGAEVVVGDEHLLELMREALAGGSDSGDIIIPVYIGNERLDELVVTAQQRYNYRSGGRS